RPMVRPCIACASASSRRGVKRSPLPRNSRKKNSSTPGSRADTLYDFALAILSGLLLTVSFPKFGHPAFGWIALTPLLVALAEAPPASVARTRPLARAFALGLVTGAVYFTGTLYWVTAVMVTYGNLQWWVAVLINAGLVAYQSAYPALFAPLVRWLVIR